MNFNVLISCEHAGNSVPEKYRSLFIGAEEVLNSHRGWDPGAHEVATFLSQKLSAPLYETQITRLLVEMNRSQGSDELFSEYTQVLSARDKKSILEEFYLPYRTAIENAIAKIDKPVLHLSIHSFTPILNEVVRDVDVGLLFDPSRKKELEFCHVLQQSLQKLQPEFRILLNEPYLGTDDGFTTALRKKFPDTRYLGIEIEINQKFTKTLKLSAIQASLVESLSLI